MFSLKSQNNIATACSQDSSLRSFRTPAYIVAGPWPLLAATSHRRSSSFLVAPLMIKWFHLYSASVVRVMAPSVLLDNRTISRSGESHHRAPMVIWNSAERRTEWLFILALSRSTSRRRSPNRCVPRVAGTKFSDPRRSPSRRGFPDSTMLSAVSTMRFMRRAIKRALSCRWRYHYPSIIWREEVIILSGLWSSEFNLLLSFLRISSAGDVLLY
jgi:hypothetical protein